MQSKDMNDACRAGPIPEEIGRLTNLSELDLSHNHLTGMFAHGANNPFVVTLYHRSYLPVTL